MSYTNEPALDAAQRDYERDRWLESRPICDWCGEHIQDEWMYMFDGKTVCETCMEECRYSVDDWM